MVERRPGREAGINLQDHQRSLTGGDILATLRVEPSYALVLGGKGTHGLKRRALSSLQAGLNTVVSTDVDGVMQGMLDAFRATHEELRQQGAREKISVAAVKVIEQDGKRLGIVANIGTARVYLLRKGELSQLTVDQGFRALPSIEEEVASRIDTIENQEELDQFKSEQFGSLRGGFFWGRRHEIVQGLGMSAHATFSPRVYGPLELEAGDQLLLEDGIHQNVSCPRMKQVLTNPQIVRPLETLVNHGIHVATSPLAEIRSTMVDVSGVLLTIPASAGGDSVRREERREREETVVEYDLEGEAVRLVYNGNPIEIELPGRQVLHFGRLEDLGFQTNPESRRLYYLVDHNQIKVSGGKRGFMPVGESAHLPIGTSSHHAIEINNPEDVNSTHARISTEGRMITITDYNTTNGTKVRYNTQPKSGNA